MQNELVNTQTGEITTNNTVSISPDGRFMVYKDESGEFVRKQIYKEFTSVKPETREQQIAYFNLLNDEDNATPMKDAIGAQIKVRDVIHQPYDSVNKKTGQTENGVVTYIIGQDDKAFVTSSKSVYNSLENIFNAFGKPSYSDDIAPIIQIVSQAGQTKGRTVVNVKLIG